MDFRPWIKSLLARSNALNNNDNMNTYIEEVLDLQQCRPLINSRTIRHLNQADTGSPGSG